MRFNMDEWELERINKNSLFLRNKRTGAFCLIGRWTFNNLRRYNNRVRLVNIPNPHNPFQVLPWIKIDKRG